MHTVQTLTHTHTSSNSTYRDNMIDKNIMSIRYVYIRNDGKDLEILLSVVFFLLSSCCYLKMQLAILEIWSEHGKRSILLIIVFHTYVHFFYQLLTTVQHVGLVSTRQTREMYWKCFNGVECRHNFLSPQTQKYCELFQLNLWKYLIKIFIY